MFYTSQYFTGLQSANKAPTYENSRSISTNSMSHQQISMILKNKMHQALQLHPGQPTISSSSKTNTKTQQPTNINHFTV